MILLELQSINQAVIAVTASVFFSQAVTFRKLLLNRQMIDSCAWRLQTISSSISLLGGEVVTPLIWTELTCQGILLP